MYLCILKKNYIMDQDDYKQIENVFLVRLNAINTRFVRYLYDQINWDSRLIGIKGARGVGKTTMLLQRIKKTYKKLDTVFYASLDNMWFQTHTLLELTEWLYQRGVRHLFLDEVHKYPDWAQVIKNIYDTYVDLNIVYTGSSMLEIDHSRVDLSRRQTMYTLFGLSFREYLMVNKILDVKAMPLAVMLEEHTSHAMSIGREVPILKYFSSYLKEGYYPFQLEAGGDFLPRLSETAELVIDSDLPAVENISYSTLQKTKQLLMVVSKNVPLTPNISKLSAQLETTRDMCLKMLYLLDRAGLLMLLTREEKSYKHLVGPEKIYLGNTNLMYALGSTVNEGTLRETFFLNQMSVVTTLTATPQGDFKTEEGLLFEVGGRGKDFTQVANLPHSYLAIDDVEYSSGNRIPLWMFGMLY